LFHIYAVIEKKNDTQPLPYTVITSRDTVIIWHVDEMYVTCYGR